MCKFSSERQRRGARGVLTLAGLPLAFACGATAEPLRRAAPGAGANDPKAEESIASEPAAPAADPSSSENTPGTATSSDGKAIRAESTGSESAESIAALCASMCGQVENKCSKKRAQSCRANCDDYVERAGRCEGAVRAALECLRGPGISFCSALAPEECREQIKAATACEPGSSSKSEGGAGQGSAGRPVPAGWQRVRVVEGGFSVALPAGARMQREPGGVVWQGSESGVDYEVRLLPSAGSKPSDRQLLKDALTLVSESCASKLRLHGRIDRDDRSSVLLDAPCKDGSRWHGIYYVLPGRIVRGALHAPKDAPAKDSDFVYSFDFRSE